MTESYSSVQKAEKVRCRPEDAGRFLLYNPRTDQLHLLDERGKRIFDLCDGRPIDDVVRESCALFEGDSSQANWQQVIDFLCSLKKRDLVVMR
ncbi:MAG: PqqD family protein [Opitutaceae bacterium]|nr:PqqD family protein [Opitutaceae bacterium]